MRIMGSSSGPREDAHWGQCFEEFYGPEYCKNLKKDLEKLKDEFYEGNAQRFQREWVMPTANLLRRMRHMGFPVRTRDHVIIHLYNPVDSMFAGEMHFQVGRKAPGTLTLKFTKQNSNGLFVIQPKTLSIADESKLQKDPLDFLDKVRLEMRDSAVDISHLLQTLVLMTETCKLQRQSAKVFFAHVKENAGSSTTTLNSHPFHDMPPAPQFAITSIPLTSNQWLPGVVNPDSIRQDGSYPFPLNFCVKNYVNCNPKPEINPLNLLASSHYRLPNGPQTAGAAYRQSRSSTWHSEPEENDETMNLQSFTENNWPRMPPDSLAEIQRRMSDTRLWEASKGPHMPLDSLEDIQRRMSDTRLWEASKGAGPSVDQKLVSNPAYGQPFWHYGQGIPESKVIGSETRTSMTDDYTGDLAEKATEPIRHILEQRTAGTEAYVQEPSEMPTPFRKDSGERTSATEDYAGEASAKSYEESVLKGTFANAIASGHKDDTKPDPSGNVSPRTAVVNDYTNGSRNMNGYQNNNGPQNVNGYQQNVDVLQIPGSSRYPFVPWLTPTAMQSSYQGPAVMTERKNSAPGMYITPDTSESRRTSSLDAYVGSSTTGLKVYPEDPRARSEGNLTATRTNTVDQYFERQNQNSRPPNYVWDVPEVRKLTNGHELVNNMCQPPNGYVKDMTDVQSQRLEKPRVGPEECANSLDSWMSHAGSASLMAQNNRLRASSFGGGPRGRYSDEDISLLSHTSYPSWGSHPTVHMNPGGGMLPLAIEQINNDEMNWQKYAPENSLN